MTSGLLGETRHTDLPFVNLGEVETDIIIFLTFTFWKKKFFFVKFFLHLFDKSIFRVDAPRGPSLDL